MKKNKKELVNKTSTNLKGGKFKVDELMLYGLDARDIKTILDYQEKLPVLQEDNGNWIDARVLHEQLLVSRKFADWIKEQIDTLDLIEGIEYSIKWLKDNVPFKRNAQYSPQKMVALGYSQEYFLKTEVAKEIAMIAGVKGGRTSKELKEMSRLARRYFIAIEKAFKNRVEWNFDRDETITMCKELKRTLIVFNKELKPTLPKWSRGITYMAEFAMLNEVIIGMSATDFRYKHCLSKTYPIRNKFSERELEYVHILEKYDSDLIRIQGIFNYEKRKEILIKKFSTMVN